MVSFKDSKWRYKSDIILFFQDTNTSTSRWQDSLSAADAGRGVAGQHSAAKAKQQHGMGNCMPWEKFSTSHKAAGASRKQ